MERSEYKHQLAEVVKRAKLSKINTQDHWLYVPEELREALLSAKDGLDVKTIAKIAGFEAEVIEKWLEEYQFVVSLKEKVDHYKLQREPNQPHHHAIRPDVCKLAKMTSPWTAGKFLDLPRSSIGRWIKKGWGDLFDPSTIGEETLSEDTVKNILSDKDKPLEFNIDEDSQAKQLEIFLERHKGKVRKKYSPAEKKLILKVVERFGSKVVHVKFGVSYDTIARLKRQSEMNLGRRQQTPLRYIPVVELMKKYPGMGPTQIRDYLKRHFGLSMGVNSVRKVMEQHGWVPPFAKTTRINTDIRSYEAIRRNYLWHMDFKHQYINKSKAYILFIQDDQSRFIVGSTVTDSENIDDLLATVEETIRIHGKPETIMSDGGSAFYSWRGTSKFTRFLEDYGIDQFIAQKPMTNGKVENLNQQVEKELLLTTTFSSLKHFDAELAKWIGFYNFSRPHQGLGDIQVPADRFFPGAASWYNSNSQRTSQQSLIAETMATLLYELKKAS